jgi:EamA domain-containing membrane protein RarD
MFERTVIGGVITGGPVAVVRASSAAVRRSETGFLRYYAAAMVICMFGVALYFLVSSS